jgi:hypothetical protein
MSASHLGSYFDLPSVLGALPPLPLPYRLQDWRAGQRDHSDRSGWLDRESWEVQDRSARDSWAGYLEDSSGPSEGQRGHLVMWLLILRKVHGIRLRGFDRRGRRRQRPESPPEPSIFQVFVLAF